MAMLEKKKDVADESLLQEVIAQTAALEEAERALGHTNIEVKVAIVMEVACHLVGRIISN